MGTRKISLAITALLVVFMALSASATVIDQSADAVNNTFGVDRSWADLRLPGRRPHQLAVLAGKHRANHQL